ncbi:ankyrin repeat domain-containing protein [Legionella longbeachae]|uniref:ankyrin repeat domain-containing protein n=1 Tax=Legionella longbeachae TaxID=450 RepID=UPI000A1C00A5|nr:ankyrin repeat domain-containing protein [Legionella longbeachae]ARM32331.1 ankyrin repeat domain-containing protein [Legionella longbeachae]
MKEFLEAIKSNNWMKINELLSEQNENALSILDCNEGFQLAAQLGNIQLVKHLLNDSRVNPAAYSREAIEWAVNPSRTTNQALQLAVIHGHFDVVEVLLLDPRIDPANVNSIVIEHAARYNRVPILKRLLEDERIDPAANHFQSLKVAIQQKHDQIILFLVDYYSSRKINYQIQLNKKQIEYMSNLTQRESLNPVYSTYSMFHSSSCNHQDTVYESNFEYKI